MIKLNETNTINEILKGTEVDKFKSTLTVKTKLSNDKTNEAVYVMEGKELKDFSSDALLNVCNYDCVSNEVYLPPIKIHNPYDFADQIVRDTIEDYKPIMKEFQFDRNDEISFCRFISETNTVEIRYNTIENVKSIIKVVYNSDMEMEKEYVVHLVYNEYGELDMEECFYRDKKSNYKTSRIITRTEDSEISEIFEDDEFISKTENFEFDDCKYIIDSFVDDNGDLQQEYIFLLEDKDFDISLQIDVLK